MVLRGKEIGKLRVERIIPLRNDFRITMGLQKQRRKEKGKRKRGKRRKASLYERNLISVDLDYVGGLLRTPALKI